MKNTIIGILTLIAICAVAWLVSTLFGIEAIAIGFLTWIVVQLAGISQELKTSNEQTEIIINQLENNNYE